MTTIRYVYRAAPDAPEQSITLDTAGISFTKQPATRHEAEGLIRLGTAAEVLRLLRESLPQAKGDRKVIERDEKGQITSLVEVPADRPRDETALHIAAWIADDVVKRVIAEAEQ